jgi:Recombination endonuclease VII
MAVSDIDWVGHGMTLNQATALLHDQRYRCAICGLAFWETIGGDLPVIHVDGHGSDVRGYLCDPCFTRLRVWQDGLVSITADEWSADAAAYLAR